ncbi:hypothetical protein C0991_004309 [Blastosporella zonata]|nr:hypothetical protein C0991_004309 [Blastosporella zonata]
MVIASLRSQVQDLFSQVTELNNKLVQSYDRVSDLEDDLHMSSANNRSSSLKISQLELERTQHLSALNTGLLVEKTHVTAELNRLMEKATEEAAQRGQAETARRDIEKDLDDLSATLFGQANTMVAEARFAQHLSEQKVDVAERALKSAEEAVGVMQQQMQALQAEKEESERNMDMTIGRGIGRRSNRNLSPRLLSSHPPYQEFLLFVAHLRTVHSSSSQPPAMATLLPLPFFARLLTEDSLWAFVRAGIIEKIWEEEVPTLATTATTPTGEKPPIPPRRRGIWGMASALGERATSWSEGDKDKSKKVTVTTPTPPPPAAETKHAERRRLPPLLPPSTAGDSSASPPAPEKHAVPPPLPKRSEVRRTTSPPETTGGVDSAPSKEPKLPPRPPRRPITPASVPLPESRPHTPPVAGDSVMIFFTRVVVQQYPWSSTVRFLDNFSAGTRGATSAEYFLQAGYAVIFMHRQFSLQPFSRHYSHSTNPFLDFLEIEPSQDGTTSPPGICVTHNMREDLLQVLMAYKSVHAAGTLHTMNFVTVNDYLWLLRAVSQELSVLGKKAMYYLAAAVSDFFLPRQKMSEHKIQSGKGSLHIEMDQVPKILKPMVTEWTKGEGFIVSFKLETDQQLLIPKARAALERYGHQVVIGNDLHRRKHEVVFVSRKGLPSNASKQDPEDPAYADTFSEMWLTIPVPTASPNPATTQIKEIEEDITMELLKRHERWIAETR